MARRLPGIRGRMEFAAVELFATQGFEATTGAQIAERAGTTERTFFRHFTDKADAAFGDETRLQDALVAAVHAHPAQDGPWAATLTGILAVAELIEATGDNFRRRAAVVAASPTLRDRETARGSHWAALITDALQSRGTEPAQGDLCAALGLTLVRLAIPRWLTGETQSLSDAVLLIEQNTRNTLQS